MKSHFVIAVAALAALLFAGQVAAAGSKHKDATFVPAGKFVYQDIIPGTVAFGTVSGDRAKGAHGTFVKIPAGKATPLHTHGATYEAVVIQGKFKNPIPGNEKSNTVLTAGSFYRIPAGAKHVTRCATDSPVDCITFFYQNVAFDFEVAK